MENSRMTIANRSEIWGKMEGAVRDWSDQTGLSLSPEESSHLVDNIIEVLDKVRIHYACTCDRCIQRAIENDEKTS